MNHGKLESLRALVRSYGSCVVAYSGGVDSVFLAKVAHEVLAERALAVIADSPSLPRAELAEAVELGERFNFPVRVVKTDEFANPNYTSNPLNRCYYCKHELFEHLTPIARDEGFAVIAYGENASDVGDFRPGAQAAKEFQVRAPLKEVGITKAEIREWSAQMGLPTADKPQMACLSSRIPHGEPVTEEKLRMVEAAELVLRKLGFYDVRVRHHELKPEIQNPKPETSRTPHSALARIEVGQSELPKLTAISQQVTEELQRLGYQHVTVDLAGYRRGGANEVTAS